MRYTLLYIYIGIMMLFGSLAAKAQGEARDANVRVSFYNTVSKESTYRMVMYALFKTENKANQVRTVLELKNHGVRDALQNAISRI